jgi:hypothetical protein
VALLSLMQRDPDLYRRTEFGWFLGALAFATSVAAVLPVWWWLKLVTGVVLAFVLLPVLGWLSGPLGRVLRFLLDPVVSLPSRQIASVGGGAVISTALDVRAVAANHGVDPNDPRASRVLVRNERGGELQPWTIWPADIDPVPKMYDALQALDPERVYELRAMQGYEQVGLWRPTLRVRMARAWSRAADPR